jgi:hypothetical protein
MLPTLAETLKEKTPFPSFFCVEEKGVMMPFTSQKTESQRPPRFAAQALT